MKKLFYILLLLILVVACTQQGWAQSSPTNYAWKYVGNAGFSAGGADYTSLAFNPSGDLYITYEDIENQRKISVMKFNGTNWIYIGTPGFSRSWALYTQAE